MIKHIYDIYHIFGGGEGERERGNKKKRMREIEDRQEKKRKHGNTSAEKFLPRGK